MPRLSKLVAGAFGALSVSLTAAPALAAGGAEHPKNVDFSFEGPLGRFDQAQLQRGFKVYREVCAACHSTNLVSFRHLGNRNAPFWDPERPNPNENPYVRTIAAEYQINDIDSETGDTIQRPGTPADRMPSPYPNEAAARAGNGGALPPDLSVIAKARHGGSDYLYSLLTGYVTPPKGLTVPAGQYFNPYYAGDLSSYWAPAGKSPEEAHESVPHGGFLAMPPPLRPGLVTFDDGTPSTVAQQARDVAAYLQWVTEPKLIERKQTGLAVILYLTLFAGLVYASYRRIWRNVAH
jgi:ubiquinol-cytochrome c reductase cytochrome c1 subunit